ncbi:MAG: hypothetical protein QXK37_02850 [Candidatus Woesearchaeota archaeon]
MKTISDLSEWIERLKESNKLIIVEGKKDRRALEKIGIKGIMTLSGRPIFQVIEDASTITRSAVILTDLDKEGRAIYGRLYSGLQMHGVEIDNVFREWLYRNTTLCHIEGINTYFESCRNKNIKNINNKKRQNGLVAEEEIELVDLNSIDEDYDFLGNAKKQKQKAVYKAGGPRRSQKKG